MRRTARGQATRIRLGALREAAELSERVAEMTKRPAGMRERMLEALTEAIARIGGEPEDERPAEVVDAGANGHGELDGAGAVQRPDRGGDRARSRTSPSLSGSRMRRSRLGRPPTSRSRASPRDGRRSSSRWPSRLRCCASSRSAATSSSSSATCARTASSSTSATSLVLVAITRGAPRVFTTSSSGGPALDWAAAWGCSSAGRASHWQCEGHGFESRQLHRIEYPPRVLNSTAGTESVLRRWGSPSTAARLMAPRTKGA